MVWPLKSKDTPGACLCKNTSLSVPMIYALFWSHLLEKNSTIENKIKNQFTVRSQHSNFSNMQTPEMNE